MRRVCSFVRAFVTGVGDGGQERGSTCPLKLGKNIFRAIIMKNAGIFRAKIMYNSGILLTFRANIIKIGAF